MLISIINDTELPKEEIQRTIRAINRQLSEDFKRYWHRDVQVRLEGWTGEQINRDDPINMRGDAVIYLWDKHDLNDALGYHSRNDRGIPYGFVFTTLAEELGESWSVTLSHEVLEMAVDPEANLLARGPHPDPAENNRTVYHWYELCDAVQNTTYEIDGVEVANFLLPLYFTSGEEHQNHNDFLGTSVRSFKLSPGGYVGFFDPKTQRHETFSLPNDAIAKRRKKAKASYSNVTRSGRHGDQEESDWTLAVECDAVTFSLGEEGTLLSATETVLRTLGEDWRVEPVASSPGEFDAVREPSAAMSFSQGWEFAHQLADTAGVEWAEPSFTFPIPGTSDVGEEDGLRASWGGKKHLPGSGKAAWGLKMCGVPAAWKHVGKDQAGKGVLVGHPDSGYRHHHEMDPDRVRADIDFDFLDADASARHKKGNHGLSTASVIMSGKGGGDDHIRGPALHAEILPLRVTKPKWWGLPAPVLVGRGMRRLRNAITYATRQGCGVISMSLGGPMPNKSLRRAIRRARQQGLIVLAAAGNQVRFVVWPARWDEVIAVAGCNVERKHWKGSCRGSAVDITAPAESVWRAFCEKNGAQRIGRSSGTSYAVALTAGVAAMWVAHHGHRNLINKYGGEGVQDVFLHLVQETAQKDHQLPKKGFGAGILDAEAVLKASLPAEVPAPRRMAAAGIDRELDEMAAQDLESLPDGLATELITARLLQIGAARLIETDSGYEEAIRAQQGERARPIMNGISARLQAALKDD